MKYAVDLQILPEPVLYCWNIYLVDDVSPPTAPGCYRSEYDSLAALQEGMKSNPCDKINIYGNPSTPVELIRELEAFARELSQEKFPPS
jgi:hypothetical protein